MSISYVGNTSHEDHEKENLTIMRNFLTVLPASILDTYLSSRRISEAMLHKTAKLLKLPSAGSEIF